MTLIFDYRLVLNSKKNEKKLNKLRYIGKIFEKLHSCEN